MATRPDDGIDLSSDAPTGEPVLPPGGGPDLVPEAAPGDGGVIAPGPTPESR